MAGGLTYTALDSTELSTAEIYGQTLVELGKEHPEIVGLTADLAGSTKIGVFGKAYPDRFFNVGIAEQNMFGVAAGMAKAGLVPFLSTFSVFASLRSADQLHTDICYQNVNAKIIIFKLKHRRSNGNTSFLFNFHPVRNRMSGCSFSFYATG